MQRAAFVEPMAEVHRAHAVDRVFVAPVPIVGGAQPHDGGDVPIVDLADLESADDGDVVEVAGQIGMARVQRDGQDAVAERDGRVLCFAVELHPAVGVPVEHLQAVRFILQMPLVGEHQVVVRLGPVRAFVPRLNDDRGRDLRRRLRAAAQRQSGHARQYQCTHGAESNHEDHP
jgi:hypothetical protein